MNVTTSLLETGADSGGDDSPLAAAVKEGNLETFNILVEPGVNAQLYKNKETGKTLMHLAAMYGHAHLIQPLVDAGVSAHTLDHYGETPLHMAAMHGFAHLIQPLVDAGVSVHTLDNHGQTLLHVAARKLKREECELLIKCGINVNAADNYGNTPLQKAAGRSNTTLVEVLLHNGANVHTANHKGETPLHGVVNDCKRCPIPLSRKEGVKTIEVLIKAGALCLSDSQGITPLDMAQDIADGESVVQAVKGQTQVPTLQGLCKHVVKKSVGKRLINQQQASTHDVAESTTPLAARSAAKPTYENIPVSEQVRMEHAETVAKLPLPPEFKNDIFGYGGMSV